MLDQDVKVINQVEDASFVDGQTVRYIVVRFRVGTHGPFSLKLPKDGFTAQQRDDAVNAMARELRVS